MTGLLQSLAGRFSRPTKVNTYPSVATLNTFSESAELLKWEGSASIGGGARIRGKRQNWRSC